MRLLTLLILPLVSNLCIATPVTLTDSFATESTFHFIGFEPIETDIVPVKSNVDTTTHHLRQELIKNGQQLIGTPYRWGGTTPSGFDCSGFVGYLYKQLGYNIPRASYAQFNQLPPVDKPEAGDLVFFRSNGRIVHVGMYIGNGQMIHSPRAGEQVRIENIEKPNWQRRYAGARRILPQGGTLNIAQAKNTSSNNTSNTYIPLNKDGLFTR